MIQNDPSRFIDELPKNLLQQNQTKHTQENKWSNRRSGKSTYEYGDESNAAKSTNITSTLINPISKIKEHIPSVNFKPSDTSGLQTRLSSR